MASSLLDDIRDTVVANAAGDTDELADVASAGVAAASKAEVAAALSRAERALDSEVLRHHEMQAARLKADRQQCIREAEAARAAAAATATAAALAAAKANEQAAREDDSIDDYIVAAVAEETRLASEFVMRASDNASDAAKAAAAGSQSIATTGDGRDLVAACKDAGNSLLVMVDQVTGSAERQDLLERAEQAYSRALEADPGRCHPSTPAVLANRGQFSLLR